MPLSVVLEWVKNNLLKYELYILWLMGNEQAIDNIL